MVNTDEIRWKQRVEYLSEDDCEIFLDALSKRDLLSHTYREEIALQAEALIKDQYHPMFQRMYAMLKEKSSA